MATRSILVQSGWNSGRTGHNNKTKTKRKACERRWNDNHSPTSGYFSIDQLRLHHSNWKRRRWRSNYLGLFNSNVCWWVLSFHLLFEYITVIQLLWPATNSTIDKLSPSSHIQKITEIKISPNYESEYWSISSQMNEVLSWGKSRSRPMLKNRFFGICRVFNRTKSEISFVISVTENRKRILFC